MTFFEKLNELCTKSGISADKLCKELGLSNATATKWRQGAEPRNSTKKAIADYFGIPVDYFNGDIELIPAKHSTDLDSSLTPDELKLIQAYREHPEMHEAINRLLLRSDAPPAYIPYKLAAHGGENEAYEDDDEPKTT